MNIPRAADIFRAAADVQRLFPAGFNVLAECMKHGIRAVRVTDGGFFDIEAAYDPEAEEIELNAVPDRRALAEVLSRRHGIRIDPTEEIVWRFFHECGHHVRRRQLLAIEGSRALIFSRSSEVLVEEREAEAYAKRRFLEWKRRDRG